ncbi:MAG: DUF1573 domain-containing protein [Flavobacteriales bacterium]|jgi:hypothetical protein|nr:DUF1573 domain-containing protein [Flavobacteriales bacterium]
MKKTLLSLFFLAFAGMSMAQVISFEKTVHDFGTIDYAGNGTTYFVYKNTGKKPLIITKAKGSCGCTVPVVNKDPLMPGMSDSVMVKYDTKRPGNFQKSVTITSNSTVGAKGNTAGQSRSFLKIKGKVGAKPSQNSVNLLNKNKTKSMMAPSSNGAKAPATRPAPVRVSSKKG